VITFRATTLAATVLTLTALVVAGCSSAKEPTATRTTTTVSAAPSTEDTLDSRLVAHDRHRQP
jgi:hypothetical protein